MEILWGTPLLISDVDALIIAAAVAFTAWEFQQWLRPPEQK